MEGADPIEDPSQLGRWVDAGVRIVGLAWGRTRYSGGTGAPGGFTPLGRRLLEAMARKKLILDLSHLAERAVREALEAWRGPVIASHSNARALAPGDRQLSDQTVAEIARRGGVVGVSFYKKHLGAEGRPNLDGVVSRSCTWPRRREDLSTSGLESTSTGASRPPNHRSTSSVSCAN
jgi:membrane dipeptidase